MIKISLFFYIWMCSCAVLLAQDSDHLYYDTAYIAQIEAGALCALQPDRQEADPNSATGIVDIFTVAPDFTWATQRIPASLGIDFGIHIYMQPGIELDQVQVTTRHPPFEGYSETQSTRTRPFRSGGVIYLGYGFDFPFEVVTGKWSFEAHYEERLIYRVVFDVVPAGDMPQITNGCRAQDMS